MFISSCGTENEQSLTKSLANMPQGEKSLHMLEREINQRISGFEKYVFL